MQIILLILTICGAIIAFVAALLSGNLWLGGLALLITIIGSVWQYILSKPFIKDFTEADWTPSSEGYLLSVPATKHLRGQSVSPTVYGKNSSGYEVVFCDEVMEANRFFIRANKPFVGKIVLK